MLMHSCGRGDCLTVEVERRQTSAEDNVLRGLCAFRGRIKSLTY